MHAAAIEPSSPARYPDSVAANCVALSADLRSAPMTSLTVGGFGGDALVVVVVVSVVVGVSPVSA